MVEPSLREINWLLRNVRTQPFTVMVWPFGVAERSSFIFERFIEYSNEAQKTSICKFIQKIDLILFVLKRLILIFSRTSRIDNFAIHD